MADTTPKPNRWTRRILVVSLAFNLLIIGGFAGLALKGGPGDRAARFDLTAGPVTRAMAPQDRDALRDTLRETGVFQRGARDGMRADMQALVDVLRADTFDGAAFRAVMSRQRARLQDGQDRVLDAMAAQIDEMSPQARTEFADRLEQQLRRGPPRRE